MLILGHVGITLGAAVLLNRALVKHHRLPAIGRNPKSWLTALGNRIDIRILLIGSLLPDFIDKPVGQLLLRDTLNSGRIFCHTLLFVIVLTLAGVCLYQARRKTWLLVLSGGSFAHLVFDEMWLRPRTLFWPIFGLAFERVGDLTYWLRGVWYALLTEPAVYVPELAGTMILIWFTLALLRRRRVYSFLKNGQV